MPAQRAGQDWIVPLRAVAAVHGAQRALGARGGVVADRPARPALGAAPAGRRGRARCLLHLADGTRHEAYVHRVGADFLEARGPAGERLLVPYAGLVAVQSRED